VSAEPASPAPEPAPEPELELVVVVEPEPVEVEVEVEVVPEPDESPAHEEPVSGVVAGVVDEGLVVVVGSDDVEGVVEPLVDVVVSVLWVEVVEVVGVVLSELLAGHPAVPVDPVVVVAGVVAAASTVGSVWVWVRPAGGAGVVLAFVPVLVAASPPACLAVGLVAVLCELVVAALSVAGLWRCVTAGRGGAMLAW
jgi:hypothetical protein